MNEFEIKKFDPEKEGLRNTKYPWAKMEVNDSFIIKEPIKNANGQVRNYVSNANRKYKGKRKYHQKITSEGLIIWRSE